MHLDADINSAANPQLVFGIMNSGGDVTAENVIYVTPDSTYNRVAVQISLTSGSTVLAPGTWEQRRGCCSAGSRPTALSTTR